MLITIIICFDCFGNVLISTDFTEKVLPTNSTRKEVFEFMKELKEIMPLLPSGVFPMAVSLQNVSNTLLARLYLNAEVYTGSPRWQDCLDACDEVQGYQLTPNYKANFAIQNEKSPEIIFAVHTIISGNGWKLPYKYDLSL